MRRRWRYRPDGTSYEVPVERASVPRAAQFLGDKTLERRMASEGKVPIEEWRGIQQDAQQRKQDAFERQRESRKRAVIEAAKRHTRWH